MSYEDVKYLSSISWVAVGSDGSSLSSKAPLNEGNPHPRSFGTFTKFFKDMVKKGNVVSVQEAVRKMTSLPASRLELKKRGLLKKGNFADICIFSLDESTYFVKVTLNFKGISEIKSDFIKFCSSLKFPK